VFSAQSKAEAAAPPVNEAVMPTDFEALYRAQFAFVWRTLKRLGVAEASLDDAAQEVFLVVHRRIADFRPETSLKAWLFAIAQRVASTQRRSVRRKGHLVALQDDLVSKAQSPLQEALTREASEIVLDFLQQLDEDRRAVFILTDLEQMTAPEIAASTGANLNTVYSRIASARKAFAAFVGGRHQDMLEHRHE
jgi:RNA polymerase sigma-70 factor (ECF subfamily)